SSRADGSSARPEIRQTGGSMRPGKGIHRGKEARVARGTVAIGLQAAWTAVLGAYVLLGPGAVPAQAQPTPEQLPRVRVLMGQARDAYVRGDFETAGRLYQLTQQQADQLTPAEVADLESQVRQNNTALKARLEGRAQIQQANEALDKGLRPKANSLLRM